MLVVVALAEEDVDVVVVGAEVVGGAVVVGAAVVVGGGGAPGDVLTLRHTCCRDVDELREEVELAVVVVPGPVVVVPGAEVDGSPPSFASSK